MKKILFFIVFIFSVTNTAHGYFPEYENQINKNGKNIIENINKQSLSTNQEYINSARKIIESGSYKNKNEKNTLVDFIMINDRVPVALNATGMIESTGTNLTLQNNIISLATIASVYNRTNAVNYANKWALSRNPNYNFYAGLNDCTNYTSQVLQAGGLPYIVSGALGKYDTKNWYYANTPNAEPSYTWGGANNFYAHALYYTSKYSIAATFGELKLGDIIQVDWERNGTVDHSMVVTSKTGTSTSQIYVSYHSTDTKNRQLSNLIAQYPTAKYIGWKVIY